MIYITGASGFLGKNLISFFKKKEIDFKAYSRKKSEDTIQVEKYTEIEENRDAIILHLASNSDTSSNIFTEEIDYYSNISKKKWKHQFFFSSAQVYDSKSEIIKNENSSINPNNNYGRKKYEIEKIFLKIENSTILRLSNIIGQGMSKKNVFNSILYQLRLGSKIKLENTYSVRDFISVNDLVRIITFMIDLRPCGIFNISTGRGTQINQILIYMTEIMNKYKYKLEVNDKSNRISNLVLDNSKIKNLCNIDINIDIKDIIRDLIENKKI